MFNNSQINKQHVVLGTQSKTFPDLKLGFSMKLTYSSNFCPFNLHLISEKQGLEKFRSVSNLEKNSGPAQLEFFSVFHLIFFQVYGINQTFF